MGPMRYKTALAIRRHQALTARTAITEVIGNEADIERWLRGEQLAHDIAGAIITEIVARQPRVYPPIRQPHGAVGCGAADILKVLGTPGGALHGRQAVQRHIDIEVYFAVTEDGHAV